MRTNRPAKSRSLWTCLVLLCLSAAPLSAEKFGLFTYSVVGDTVKIDGYPRNEVGDVEIPNEIDGKPVTEIRRYAFRGCTGLTSVAIPGSVTSIGIYAFSGCSGLKSIEVSPPHMALAGTMSSGGGLRVEVRKKGQMTNQHTGLKGKGNPATPQKGFRVHTDRDS